MSLIQAALNKTALSQRPPNSQAQPESLPLPKVRPVPVSHAPAEVRSPRAPRIWPPNLLDEKLEKELIAVQDRHSARRLFWWKAGAGVFLLFVLTAGLTFKAKSGGQHPAVFPAGQARQTAVSLPEKPVPAHAQRPAPAAGVVPYRLSGIADLGDGPRAIINDRIVAAGDMLSQQAVVKEIRRNEVILNASGQEILLSL